MADRFDHLKTDVPFSGTNNAVITVVLSIASTANHTYGPFHYWVADRAIINEATSYFSSRGLDVVKFTPFTNRTTWIRTNSVHALLQTVDLTVQDPNVSTTPNRPIVPPPPPLGGSPAPSQEPLSSAF